MEAEEENLSEEKRLSLGQEVLLLKSFFGEELKETLSSSSMTIFDILSLSECVPIHFV